MSEEKKCRCHEGETCSCEEETCECIKEEKKEQNKKKVKKDKHLDKLNEAFNKISELEDSLLRSKADFINYRKRLEDEQVRLFKYCNEDLVKEMLPIIDSLERCISMDDNNLDDEVSKYLSGVKMIYCNLTSILNKYGVKDIDGVNKPFDPAFHQAVMTEKCDMESGMVIEVLQKGYLLKDKVIRPAMVKVSE
ncbi:MAG: nucleotide exchange factor GrpE [Firmicutes bacterium]|nr:nucleotide exchange factor GrpE [Bacillota bacterium]